MPVNHPVFRVSGEKLVQLVQILGKVVVRIIEKYQLSEQYTGR